MVVLGLILVLAALGFGAYAVWDNTNDVNFQLASQHWTGVPIWVVFVAGAATALVFVLGLWLMSRGARRNRVRRSRLREVERDRDDAYSQLEERRRLEANRVDAPQDTYEGAHADGARIERERADRVDEEADVRAADRSSLS